MAHQCRRAEAVLRARDQGIEGLQGTARKLGTCLGRGIQMAYRNSFSASINCLLGVNENLSRILCWRSWTPWIQGLQRGWHQIKGQSPGNDCFACKSLLTLVDPSCLNTTGQFKRRLRAIKAQPSRRETSICPQRIDVLGGGVTSAAKARKRKLGLLISECCSVSSASQTVLKAPE